MTVISSSLSTHALAESAFADCLISRHLSTRLFMCSETRRSCGSLSELALHAAACRPRMSSTGSSEAEKSQPDIWPIERTGRTDFLIEDFSNHLPEQNESFVRVLAFIGSRLTEVPCLARNHVPHSALIGGYVGQMCSHAYLHSALCTVVSVDYW